jgi:hypothetical protein
MSAKKTNHVTVFFDDRDFFDLAQAATTGCPISPRQ